MIRLLYTMRPSCKCTEPKRSHFCLGWTCTTKIDRWPSKHLNLSYTNSQIRSEIQETVEAVRDAGHLTYKLDLMVDGTSVYPTWLSIPAPSKNIAKLIVDFSQSQQSRIWMGRRRWPWKNDKTARQTSVEVHGAWSIVLQRTTVKVALRRALGVCGRQRDPVASAGAKNL